MDFSLSEAASASSCEFSDRVPPALSSLGCMSGEEAAEGLQNALSSDIEEGELCDLGHSEARRFLDQQIQVGARAEKLSLLVAQLPASEEEVRETNPALRSSDVQLSSLPQNSSVVRDFEDLPLCDPLLKALKSRGFRIPTPVQAAALPVTLSGKDTLVQAKSGTGKTVAFALHFLQRLVETCEEGGFNHGSARCYSGFALVVTPTRELSLQVRREVQQLSAFIQRPSVRVACLIGGVNTVESLKQLALLPEVIVGTPGRLLKCIGAFKRKSKKACASRRRGCKNQTRRASAVLGSEEASLRTSADGALEEAPSVESLKRGDENSVERSSSKASQAGEEGGDAFEDFEDLPKATATVEVQTEVLGGLRVLVLDEADLLLGRLLKDQTNRILKASLKASVQLTAYTATVPPNFVGVLTELRDEALALDVSRSSAECTARGAFQNVFLCSSRILPPAETVEEGSCSTEEKACQEAGLETQCKSEQKTDTPGSQVLKSTPPSPALAGVIYALVEVPRITRSASSLRVLAEKLRLLLRVLSTVRFRQALVFVNDDFIGVQLSRNLTLLGVEALYTSGSLCQAERTKRVNALKTLECRVVVCSDLERDTFLHRGGRASRYGNWGVCVSVASADEADSYRYIASCYGIALRSLEQVQVLQNVLWNSFNADKNSFEANDDQSRLKPQEQLDALLSLEESNIEFSASMNPLQTTQAAETEDSKKADAALQQGIRDALEIASRRRKMLMEESQRGQQTATETATAPLLIEEATSSKDAKSKVPSADHCEAVSAPLQKNCFGLSEDLSVRLRGCFLNMPTSSPVVFFGEAGQLLLYLGSECLRRGKECATNRCRQLHLQVGASPLFQSSENSHFFHCAAGACSLAFCPVHDISQVTVVKEYLDGGSALSNRSFPSLRVASRKNQGSPASTFVRRSKGFEDSAETAFVLFHFNIKSEAATTKREVDGASPKTEQDGPSDILKPQYFVAALSAKDMTLLFLLLSAAVPVSEEKNKNLVAQRSHVRPSPSLDLRSAARWSAFVASVNTI